MIGKTTARSNCLTKINKIIILKPLCIIAICRIPPDVKEAALCVGVKNGTEETWNLVFELFKTTSSTSESQAALLALACSTNTTILSKYKLQ